MIPNFFSLDIAHPENLCSCPIFKADVYNLKDTDPEGGHPASSHCFNDKDAQKYKLLFHDTVTKDWDSIMLSIIIKSRLTTPYSLNHIHDVETSLI